MRIVSSHEAWIGSAICLLSTKYVSWRKHGFIFTARRMDLYAARMDSAVYAVAGCLSVNASTISKRLNESSLRYLRGIEALVFLISTGTPWLPRKASEVVYRYVLRQLDVGLSSCWDMIWTSLCRFVWAHSVERYALCLYVTTPNIQTSMQRWRQSVAAVAFLWLRRRFERLTYFLTYLARDFDFCHRLTVLYVQQSVGRYHQTLDTVIGRE